MANYSTDSWNGPIRGLHLPLIVWDVLINEDITTLDGLRAVADQLEQFPGIGVKMAQITREEIARVLALGEGSQSQN